MSSPFDQLSIKKSRLSLSLKRSNTEVTIANKESDKNEKLDKLSDCKEAVVATTSDNKPTCNNEEEEIIPCSQVEDKLVFSQKSPASNSDEAKLSIVPEQNKAISSSAETYFSGFSLEQDQTKDSITSEGKLNNIQDVNSVETFNSIESKISNEIKNSQSIDNSTNIQNSSSSVEIINKENSSIEIINISSEDNIDTIIDKTNGNDKKDCFSTNEEIDNIEEECNEIPNSPEAKIFQIKENKRTEFKESEFCEKKYNIVPPIIKRNVVIADSDEEFEEFANPERKLQKKVENSNSSISQKENSKSKCQKPTKVSSSSCKDKSKTLKGHRDKNNVSKTSKEKSKNLALKRKLEFTAENSDDEFETPDKRAKKMQSPQGVSMNKEVKKSKKLKRIKKSTTLPTENC